jgi:hypothetical protein
MKDDGQGNAELHYAIQVGSMGNIRIPRFEDSVDLDRLRHTLPLGRAVPLRPPENRAHHHVVVQVQYRSCAVSIMLYSNASISIYK